MVLYSRELEISNLTIFLSLSKYISRIENVCLRLWYRSVSFHSSSETKLSNTVSIYTSFAKEIIYKILNRTFSFSNTKYGKTYSKIYQDDHCLNWMPEMKSVLSKIRLRMQTLQMKRRDEHCRTFAKKMRREFARK